MGGRLKHFWKEWEILGASHYTINLLKYGLTLQFVKPPPLVNNPIFLDSYQNNKEKRKALKIALEELIEKEVLEEVKDIQTPGFYGRLFLQPKTETISGVKRLRTIINLSQLNQYIINPSFHMKTSIMIQETMRKGMWCSSIDLQDAYYHIPIHPNFRKYMRVALFDKVLQFKAMAMGLNVSARIFTKVVLEMVRKLRATGIHMHTYIDDWLLKNYNQHKIPQQTYQTIHLSTKLGWLINFPKSELIPTLFPKYVGVQYDLKLGLGRPTLNKVRELESVIQTILKQKGGTTRQWAKLIGKMGSMSRQIELGSLHRRPIQ